MRFYLTCSAVLLSTALGCNDLLPPLGPAGSGGAADVAVSDDPALSGDVVGPDDVAEPDVIVEPEPLIDDAPGFGTPVDDNAGYDTPLDSAANAEADPQALLARANAWQLGHTLSAAALGYSQGAPRPAVDSMMQKAKTLAAALGAKVPDLPQKRYDKAYDGAAALNYVLNTAGKPIAAGIEIRHGHDPSLLFQTSLKTNILMLMYAPGEGEGETIVGVLERQATETGLPNELWQGVVDQVRAGAPADQVKAGVLKMQNDVHAHLASAVPAGTIAATEPDGPIDNFGGGRTGAGRPPFGGERGVPSGPIGPGGRGIAGRGPGGRGVSGRGLAGRGVGGRGTGGNVGGANGGNAGRGGAGLAAKVDPPADPTPPAAGQQYLSDLAPTGVITIADAEHAIDRAFTVGGVAFDHGVRLHPLKPKSSAQATYPLEGGFSRLSGAVGIGDNKFRRSFSALTFRLLGDGKPLWTSQKKLVRCGQWEAFDVDVSGVSQLTLIVECAGPHTGAHGTWLDPILTRASP